MQLQSLDDVLVEQLADLHSAETQLVQALPQVAKSASTPELRTALEDHLEQTRGHVRRLEEAFSSLGTPIPDEFCKGMEGLLKEGKEIIAAKGDPAAKDAALIAASQRVEHYEIAGYGTARTLADQLFETYVPINLDGNSESDEVDAVIEIYQDYSAIQGEIDRLNDTLKISLGIGLLALYVLLVPVMVGTTRTLRRQNAQLLDQADQLGVLLAREQETVAELRELDRLKSDFAAAASHELRTPLTTIRGFAELLKQQVPSADPGTRDAIEAIARQTAHLQRLVGNLLREAQLEHGDHETIAEPTSVVDVLDEVRNGFPGSVDRIHLQVDRDLPTLALDPVALHEIVANLVDNALKYSTPGAPVVVDARIADGSLTIRVRDEGVGIAPGDLPRIFDRFTQIDQSSTRAHGGVGLGLHLVRELTRRFGGEVKVDSVMDQGTTFTVTIPVPASASPDPQHPEMSSA